jgi:hypothetical protein
VSRLEVPLRAFLNRYVRDALGHWLPQVFRVDSGSDISAMPAWHAKALGLPMPLTSTVVNLNLAMGQQTVIVRSGIPRIKVDGLSPKEHVISCHFRGDPDIAPPTTSPAALPRNLLGIAGVVDKLRITFDGSLTSLTASFGVMVVEEG